MKQNNRSPGGTRDNEKLLYYADTEIAIKLAINTK